MDDGSSSGSSPSWSSSANEDSISAYLVLFSGLLALVLILSRILHDHAILASILPEAGMILLVGMIAGFFVHLFLDKEEAVTYEGNNNDDDNDNVDYTNVAENLLSFSPNVFFVALLPPIIFNSGYHLKKALFFRHIGPIVLLAVVGTIISALSISGILYCIIEYGGGVWSGYFRPTPLELLTFGALISATDPVSTLAVFQTKKVDPHLFYLVFGESVLNDAVGLILFQTFAKLVEKSYNNINNNDEESSNTILTIGLRDFCTDFLLNSIVAPCLGILFGIGAAFLLKIIDMRKYHLLELSLYLLIMYVPFLLAEVLDLSGIVTILFTGISAKYYVVPNLSKATKLNSDVLFRLAAHLAETAIFLELGLSVFGLENKHMFQSLWKFILLSILSCLIGRALNVYPIVAIVNFCLGRSSRKFQNVDTNDGQTNNKNGSISTRNCDVNEGQVTSDYNDQNDVNDQNDKKRSRQNHKHRESNGNIELTERLTIDGHHNRCNIHSKNKNEVETRTARQLLMRYSSSSLSDTTMSHDLKIHTNTAHVLWFSGLRGAVAYACVRSFPNSYNHQKQFTLVTMTIILVTVFFMGGATEVVLNHFKIPMNIDEDEFMEKWQAKRNAKNRGNNSNQLQQRSLCQPFSFTDCISHFDKYYIRRFVIRDYGSSSTTTTTLTATPNSKTPIATPDSKRRGTVIEAESPTTPPALLITTPLTPATPPTAQIRPHHHPLHHYHQHDSQHHLSNVEMTAESHFDALEEMGYYSSDEAHDSPASNGPKESLFDFGATC